MIGLLFLLALGLWIAIAWYLGNTMPKLFGINRYQKSLGVTFALLVFMAPVADEIIAYPQMRALCASLKPYELAPGMEDKKAYGRTVYHKQSAARESLWPSTIKVTRWTSTYVDSTSKEPIFVQNWFEPQRGLLGVPKGSSGGQTTILLQKCSPKNEHYGPDGRPSQFVLLHITVIPTP